MCFIKPTIFQMYPKTNNWHIFKKSKDEFTVQSKSHQYEPLSPILCLGVNPFPSRFIYRTTLRGGFAHTHSSKTQSKQS